MGDAVDMPRNKLAVAHELDNCWVVFMDTAKAGFLEIAIDPERIGVDNGD
jgi:hypothetical protein